MNPLARLSALLRHASIRQKLAAIIALTCGAGILVAGAAVFAFHAYTLRSTFQRDIAALSAVVADNLGGPVAFGDQRAALEVLASLRAKPQIKSAEVRSRHGGTLAAIGTPAGGPAASAGARQESHFLGWELRVLSPIAVDGDTIGSLLLGADFRPTFLGSLRVFLIAISAICAGALAVALGIGYSLQGLIIQPVLRLSEAAVRVGERRDYGVRVDKLGGDELGVLTDAFNGMLERLQAADAELRRTNEALKGEIEQRRRLQHELLEASRLAGMAEVATGVLHNVGNVLNSVNVSAGVMREELQGSRLPLLDRTAGLLHEHAADLGAFFSRDERGRRIPAFLTRIAGQIAEEHGRLETELTELSRNIDHIKEIVAMQQTYAKASAVIEQVDLVELMDQALSIHRTALDRHRVRVTREFPTSLPLVPTDRHKILQVLTNFVANAIHATKANPPENRLVTVAIRFATSTRLALSVADNGEGIPPENLKKIFRQGFTTRREGHGFGLHSGVLIVKSLGGNIEAASPGVGAGATFTLHLPVTADAIPQAA